MKKWRVSMPSNVLIKNLPELEKPRERFLLHGPRYLSNEELLAIMISTGSKGYSSKELAKQLLTKLDHIEDLKNINLETLTNIKGIGNTKAINILAAIELGRRVYQTNITKPNMDFTNPNIVYEYFKQELTNPEQEHFYVIYLDNKKQLIKHKLLFIGTDNSTTTSPKEIFKEAFLSNASFIICIHNHPNQGIPSPSNDDISFTTKLNELGKLHSIPLLDHIILGNNTYYSFYANAKL